MFIIQVSQDTELFVSEELYLEDVHEITGYSMVPLGRETRWLVW